MIWFWKSFLFFHHGGPAFCLGLDLHLAVAGNLLPFNLLHISICCFSPQAPRLPRAWGKSPCRLTTGQDCLRLGLLLFRIFFFFFNLLGGKRWVTPGITGPMPSSAWNEFRSVFTMGFPREKAKSLMYRNSVWSWRTAGAGASSSLDMLWATVLGPCEEARPDWSQARLQGSLVWIAVSLYQIPWFLNLRFSGADWGEGEGASNLTRLKDSKWQDTLPSWHSVIHTFAK